MITKSKNMHSRLALTAALPTDGITVILIAQVKTMEPAGTVLKNMSSILLHLITLLLSVPPTENSQHL